MNVAARRDRFLKRHFTWKEIGWSEIGETFHRYTLFECRWFKVCLHHLDAPDPRAHRHNHPWHFWALVLWNGYWETERCGRRTWRGPLSLLYRPARFSHAVVTRTGRPNWSLCLMSRRNRDWQILPGPAIEPADRDSVQ